MAQVALTKHLYYAVHWNIAISSTMPLKNGPVISGLLSTQLTKVHLGTNRT